MGIHELGLNCEIHIYDPTVNEPAQAKSIGPPWGPRGVKRPPDVVATGTPLRKSMGHVMIYGKSMGNVAQD